MRPACDPARLVERGRSHLPATALRANCRSRRDQVPVSRKSGTVGASDTRNSRQIRDCCLARARVEYIIRVAVPVEIGSPRQLIATCNGRTIGASDPLNPRQIPDRRLTRAWIEE